MTCEKLIECLQQLPKDFEVKFEEYSEDYDTELSFIIGGICADTINKEIYLYE